MTTWFVSRHPGARDWAMEQGMEYDRLVSHLEPTEVSAGDTVIGTLPVNLASEVCGQGARYIHLSLRLPPELRGLEFTAEELRGLRATLEEFTVHRVRGWGDSTPDPGS